MDVSTFFEKYGGDELDRLASGAHTTRGYLNKMIYTGFTPSVGMAQCLLEASGRRLTLGALAFPRKHPSWQIKSRPEGQEPVPSAAPVGAHGALLNWASRQEMPQPVGALPLSGVAALFGMMAERATPVEFADGVPVKWALTFGGES